MGVSSQTLLEILKYIIPSLVVLIVTYYIVHRFLTSDIERQRLAIFGENAKTTIPLRLQAYERLAMFLERIDINDLLLRLYDSRATAKELQLALVQTIRSEFDYNLSQQIYVSNEVWQAVSTAVEQEIGMVNHISSTLPNTATAKDLRDKIMDYVVEEEETPRQIALSTVNNEAKMVLLKP